LLGLSISLEKPNPPLRHDISLYHPLSRRNSFSWHNRFPYFYLNPETGVKIFVNFVLFILRTGYPGFRDNPGRVMGGKAAIFRPLEIAPRNDFPGGESSPGPLDI
jgi:hypothetical protein